ncbi:MAG: hypothetical protein IPP32_15245 [Bacteroidetes bacterium]|nr:hypothetical protein [Bacteroidota bacterium]
MKVGTSYELNAVVLTRAKAAGVSDLVFHMMDAQLDETSLMGFKLHDTSKLTSEGKNYAWNKVKMQLDGLEQRNPKLFQFQSYDLKQAILKDVYWSLIMDNLIEQKCLEISNKSTTIIKLDAKNNPLMDYFKFLLHLFQPVKWCKGILNGEGLKGKLAVRVNSVVSIAYFGKLFDVLGTRAVIYQSALAQQPSKILANEQLQKIKCSTLSYENAFFMGDSFKFLKSIFNCQIRFLNLLLFTKRKQITAMSEFKALAQNGVRGFLLCASENEGEGIVSGLVAKMHKVKSYNFMNGTKTKDLINSFTNFEYWFMHDVRMQKMLASISNQSEQNFPITGHLMEDIAREHVYSGTLEQWKGLLAGKKVIALFSSPTYYMEQIDVENLLLDCLTKDANLIVLVRLHPGEKHSIPFSHERMILLPNFKEKSAPALFDLLLHSNLAISFASTVSLQASWFGIPSVTFEFSEKSLLVYADQEKIHHINSIKSLESFMLTSLQTTPTPIVHNNMEKSVAQKMAEKLFE